MSLPLALGLLAGSLLYVGGASEVSITGKDVLCPGEVGLYECTIINGSGLRWTVDGTRLTFGGTRDKGDSEDVPNTGIIAYLVEKDGVNIMKSVLRYEPDFNITRKITITCDDVTIDPYIMEVVVLVSPIRPPSLPILTQEDDNITFTWSHDNESLVDFYKFDIQNELRSEEVYLKTTSYVQTKPPVSIELRALDICGHLSEPQVYNVTADITPGPTSATTPPEPTPPELTCTDWIAVAAVLLFMTIGCTAYCATTCEVIILVLLYRGRKKFGLMIPTRDDDGTT